MPEISRFLGIIIYMYFNDHNPPHFHAQYGKYEATINIQTLSVIRGKLPPRVLSLVIEWSNIHQKELMSNWNNIIKEGTYKKIKPLT